MSCCRTCGNSVEVSLALDIFTETNISVVHQIELITGVWLSKKKGFPDYLCSTCQWRLAQAIAFRHCCTKTQQIYQENMTICEKSKSNHTQHISPVHIKIEIDPLDIDVDSLDAKLTEDLENHRTFNKPESATVDFIKTENDIDLNCDNLRQNEPKKLGNKKTENSVIKPNKTPNNLDNEQSNVIKKHHISNSYCCLCEICGKYILSGDLHLHQMIHTGVKNFQCVFCDEKFYTISQLNLHKRQHINPLKCSYCDETFGSNNSRLRHERIHRGERPFKCRFCEKSFRSFTSKKGHEVTHTRLRTFQCKVCCSWFLTNKHLSNHKRTKDH